MKKYDNYKDSGVEWIGKIPEHWDVKKLKFISKTLKNISKYPWINVIFQTTY